MTVKSKWGMHAFGIRVIDHLGSIFGRRAQSKDGIGMAMNSCRLTMIGSNPLFLNRLGFLPNTSHKVQCTEPARAARCDCD